MIVVVRFSGSMVVVERVIGRANFVCAPRRSTGMQWRTVDDERCVAIDVVVGKNGDEVIRQPLFARGRSAVRPHDDNGGCRTTTGLYGGV